jgi:hypothetical protein
MLVCLWPTLGVAPSWAQRPPGNDISDGAENTAYGFLALQNNTAGTSNTAVGRIALTSNTQGEGNTGIGSDALAFAGGSTRYDLTTGPTVC